MATKHIMIDGQVYWYYRCMVCNEDKPILPLLFLYDLYICDECGEWTADGCEGYPPIEHNRAEVNG